MHPPPEGNNSNFLSGDGVGVVNLEGDFNVKSLQSLRHQ